MYGLRMGLSISEILLIMAHAPFSIRLQVTMSLRPNSLASPRSQYHLSIIRSLPIGFHLVLSWLSCVAFGKRPRILRVKHCVHSWFCFIRMEVKTILFCSLRSGMQLCLCLWLYYGKKKPIILGIAGLGQYLSFYGDYPLQSLSHFLRYFYGELIRKGERNGYLQAWRCSALQFRCLPSSLMEWREINKAPERWCNCSLLLTQMYLLISSINLSATHFLS